MFPYILYLRAYAERERVQWQIFPIIFGNFEPMTWLYEQTQTVGTRSSVFERRWDHFITLPNKLIHWQVKDIGGQANGGDHTPRIRFHSQEEIWRVTVSVLGRIGVLWREQRNKSIDVRRPEICQADSLKIEDLEKCFLILEQIRKIVLSFWNTSFRVN